MRTRKHQRGQAMTEFIAAMLLFVPLILGVIYVGKYSDIKHQAIQASRYAAMERALDPKAHESGAGIGAETVARFFRDGGQQTIAADEQARGSTSSDENPNWKQIDGTPLIARYADVSVNLHARSDLSVGAPGIDQVASLQFDGLNTGSAVQADVEVPVANMTNAGPLAQLMNNLNLRIGATTVMAGDPWNASSSQDVADHQTIVSVPGRLLGKVNKALDILKNVPGVPDPIKLLVDTGLPVFGCVKPDIVPNGTPGRGAPGAQYDSSDDPGSPDNPNDKCY